MHNINIFDTEVSASGWSLVQRSPIKCGLSNVCDLKAPWGGPMNPSPVEAPQEREKRKFDIVHLFALIKEYTNLKCTK